MRQDTKFGGRQRVSRRQRLQQANDNQHFGGIFPILATVVAALVTSALLYMDDSAAQTAKSTLRQITSFGSCKIKGNISYNSGRKIYHVPGQQDYENTVISVRRGERWFCTEKEARANGWRKARH